MTTSETPYHFEKFDGASVIALLPELNDVPWADIESIGSRILERMEDQQKQLYLIDLEALTYMGSAMVALVVRIWKSVKERNGKMAVVNNDEMVLEVLSIAGLDEVWTIVDTREKGLKVLGVSARKIRSQEMTPPSAKENRRSEKWGTGMALLTLLTVAVAGMGLYLLLVPQDFIKDPRIVPGLLFGGSLLGLLIGIVTTSIGIGFKRGIGILGILSALGIGTAGVLHTPNRNIFLDKNEKKIPDVNSAAKPGTTGLNDKEDEQSEVLEANDGKSNVVTTKAVPIGNSKQAFPKITTSRNDETAQKNDASKTDNGLKEKQENNRQVPRKESPGTKGED